MKITQKGFTLIELIVVLVIIGMISAFALPRYQDHIAKTQATEALQLVEPLKVDLYESIHYSNKCIKSNDDLEEHEGKFAKAVIGNDLDYKVSLTPTDKNGKPLYDPREDTGCRIYIKYKNITNPRIKGKNLVLAYLFNGQLIALNDDITDSINQKYIPDPIKKSNDKYIVNLKKVDVKYDRLNDTEADSSPENDNNS